MKLRERKFAPEDPPGGPQGTEQEGDPDANIAPGTAFSDLPADWVCPVCGAPKEKFTVEE